MKLLVNSALTASLLLILLCFHNQYDHSMAQKVASTALRVVFVTTPSEEVATKIARAIVEQKLAACVNIVPGIKSIYEWEGKVHEDKEHLMIVKTTENKIDSLRDGILSLHPYDTPEFVALPVSEESNKYAEWVRSQTSS